MLFLVCGKTTLALQIADNIAMQGHKTIIFSLEQSKFELITKAVSRISFETKRGDARTHTAILKNKEIDQVTTDAICKYSVEVAPNEIIKEGTFNLNVEDIKSYLQNYVANTKEKPFVVIDYLQILAPSDTRLTDKQQIDHNITTLKKLSRDLDIPIFVISSFNRLNYSQTASFEAFKESGGIEYTADVLFTMQLTLLSQKDEVSREEIRQAKKENPRQVQLVCLKNRAGKSNFAVDFEFNPCFNHFREIPRERQTELN